MGGKIAPSEDPFGGWISVELAIIALRVLHDIPASFAGFNNGMTGPSIEAAARLFHKQTVRTRLDRHTFHRFALPFLYDGHLRSLHQATELSSSEGASLTVLKGGIAVVVNYQSTGKALARHSRGMNVEYKHIIIRNYAKEDKDFPSGLDNERPLFTVDVTIAFM
jgi:hypothetical protein